MTKSSFYDYICKVPFTEIEIHLNGNVYVCCPSRNNFSIGNIYENSFDKIWYSERAKELRQDILQKNYKKCNLNICNPADNIYKDKLRLIDENVELSLTPPYPKYVKFCHDMHCNIKCITCRDNFQTNSSKKNEQLNSYIDEIYLPILKNCEVVSLNGAGETLASPHGRTLIKKIIEKYPDIKFDIHTNGTLCTEKLCNELGLTDRMCSLNISMHAATKKTYEKIMVGSNYEQVIKNLAWLKTLLEKGKLKELNLLFVVHQLNYREMIPFIKFAKKFNANVYFWEYRNWGTQFNDLWDKIAVFEKYHIEYNKFAKMLQNPIFEKEYVHVNSFLKKKKPITFREHLTAYLDKHTNKILGRDTYIHTYIHTIIKKLVLTYNIFTKFR